MATEDLSRRTHDRRFNRRQLLGQVGRLITDEDITQIGDIAADEFSVDRLGIIGPHGTSNNGFRVPNVTTVDGVIDFTLEAGDYWIGGQRATLYDATTFRLQSDWLQRGDIDVPLAGQHDLVVLELTSQAVSATEQEASADPAYGGPDTAAHLRLMARVRIVTDLDEGACHDLWSETLTRWETAGFGTLDAAHELKTDAELSVDFSNAGAAQDLCAPDIDEGYLGAANAAIRVQMVSPTLFCWGFENGGRLMRATVNAARSTLTLLTDPWDEAHWPSAQQVIEILPWGAVDFNGEKLAEEGEGSHFTTVAMGYNPDDQTLTLTDALPIGFNTAWQNRSDADELMTTRFGAESQLSYVYVRVWDRGEDRVSTPALAIGADVALGLTGLTVTHTGTARTGDAWIIAARPFAPDEIAPWELRIGASPIARRRFVAPIAHLIWDGAGAARVIDCRARFRPLTRLNDCVTLRVGDGSASHGDYDRIQSAVDALPPAGGRILVLPGHYDEHVKISSRANIRIEGCGIRTVLSPATGEAAAPDDTPIVLIEGCSNITLKDMAIIAPTQLGVAAISTTEPNLAGDDVFRVVPSSGIKLKNLSITHFQRGGAWLAAVQGATVTQCLFGADGTLDDKALAEEVHRPSLFIQGRELVVTDSTFTATDFGKPLAPTLGGITIGGGSEEVLIARNLVEGCYGNGITLGSVIYVPEKDLDKPAELAKAFQKFFGKVYQLFFFAISDDNCFGLDPNPPVRDPNDGSIMVPIPDGTLYDITIQENRIRNMGGNGIGVAQYFNLDTDPFLITVEDIAILRNEISGVLNGENIAFAPEMQLVAAWAAIALADVTRAEIRENRITDNSRKHSIPAVGIFALYAEDVEIVENTIADTGRRADEIDGDGPGAGGWRGGIVITQVRPSARDFDVVDANDGAIRSDGSCALVVHGNAVLAPQGRALTAFGLGPMHVTDNRLVTQSGASSGFILAAFNLRHFGQLSLAGLLVNSLFTVVQEGKRPNASAGHLILAIMGGDVVALANMGVSNEFYLQNFGLGDRLIGDDQELGFDAPGELMVGGDIMLNNNQIRLDGLDRLSSFGVSAVALASLDNVMAQSNQISLDLDLDFMGINLLCLGFSLHVASNRLKEPALNCFCSALTLGLMNTTVINQATHCVLAFPIKNKPYLFNDHGNTELIEIWELFTGPDKGSLCSTMRSGFVGNFKKDLVGMKTFFASRATETNEENKENKEK